MKDLIEGQLEAGILAVECFFENMTDEAIWKLSAEDRIAFIKSVVPEFSNRQICAASRFLANRKALRNAPA